MVEGGKYQLFGSVVGSRIEPELRVKQLIYRWTGLIRGWGEFSDFERKEYTFAFSREESGLQGGRVAMPGSSEGEDPDTTVRNIAD